MKTLIPSLILGAVSLCSLLPQSFATPNNDGVLAELRIEKSTTDATTSVLGAAVHRDGDISPSPLKRAEETIIAKIEDLVRGDDLIEKRQTNKKNKTKKTNKKKKKKDCAAKKGKCKKDNYARDPETGKCKKCPEGQKVNPDGDGCEEDTQSEDEKKKQGKCPDGKELDPEAPDQDELTENPKCVDKEKNDECPEGQSKSTKTASQPSKCAPDDERNKKCKGKDTFPFKKIGDDGKMSTTCRSTPEKEKSKSEKVWKAQEPISKGANEKQRNDRDKKRRIRARRGACLALGAVTWMPSADIDELTDDIISGIQEPEADSPLPDKDLEDHMIEIKEKPAQVAAVVVERDLDSRGGLGSAFGQIFKFLSKLFKKGGGKAAGAAANAAKVFRVAAAPSRNGGGRQIKNLRDSKSVQTSMKASDKAMNAGRSSQVYQKLLKAQDWLDCVAMGASAVADAASKREVKEYNHEFSAEDGKKFNVNINLDAQKEDVHPSPNPETGILVVGDISFDAETAKMRMATYPDSYKRHDRIQYEQCHSLAGTDLNNALVRLQTWGGCCAYYDGEHCENKANFIMYNRADEKLKDGDSKVISSFWCTEDPNCHGAPGDSETNRKPCSKAVGEEEIADCYPDGVLHG
ncbi:unnamed protein product [Periconia digitata]|uniref:Uncharacterized protein n=1 Tax=Periconia digitata TaxID=1303443 RepID=A0A9W4UN32_9PLEO|nr:unnamed protein product [Periconia digitata]